MDRLPPLRGDETGRAARPSDEESPLSPERLRETLDELRGELARTEPDDAEARDRVQAAADEIDAWLERAEEPEESLTDRLQEAAGRFEAEHPNLAATVRRVVDALSDLGI